MAEESSEDRSQKPTARRLEKAREAGTVAQSQELAYTVSLLTGMYLFFLYRGTWISQWAFLYQNVCRSLPAVAHEEVSLISFVGIAVKAWFSMIWPLCIGIMVMGVVVSTLQTRFLFAPGLVSFDLTRLNPLSGMERIFSSRSRMEVLKIMFKLSVLGYVFYSAVRGVLLNIASYSGMRAATLFEVLSQISKKCIYNGLLFMMVIAAWDFWIQQKQVGEKLLMSRREVKEESKEMQGNPQVKARIRQLMRKMGGKRMMKKVPLANVVVTNPTHLAIALKYDSGMRAPQVIAKGADRMAAKIREIAIAHNIPLVENKPLAHILYRKVNVDSEIPPAMYQAVAEVLAYVHRLRRKAAGGLRR